MLDKNDVIKGKGIAAVWHYSPLWLPATPVLVFLSYISFFAKNLECESFWGISLFQLNLLGLSYFLPGLMLLFSCWATFFGYRVVRDKCFPPKDAVVFRDTPVKRGRFQLLRGYVLMLSPALALAAVLSGHQVYQNIAPHWQQAQGEVQCHTDRDIAERRYQAQPSNS